VQSHPPPILLIQPTSYKNHILLICAPFGTAPHFQSPRVEVCENLLSWRFSSEKIKVFLSEQFLVTCNTMLQCYSATRLQCYNAIVHHWSYSAYPSWSSVTENGSISPQWHHTTCERWGGRPRSDHGQMIADVKTGIFCWIAHPKLTFWHEYHIASQKVPKTSEWHVIPISSSMMQEVSG